MDEDPLRQIASVTLGAGPYRVQVTWRDGQQDVIDLASHIARFKLYRPIRDGRVPFGRLHVGEYGVDLVWTNEIDMSAEAVWRLARYQASGAVSQAAK